MFFFFMVMKELDIRAIHSLRGDIAYTYDKYFLKLPR